MTADAAGGLSLFRRRVRDLIARPPATWPGSLAGAGRFSRESIGSLVVVDDASTPVGIVSGRDLRTRVVAENRDATRTPAAAVAAGRILLSLLPDSKGPQETVSPLR